MSAALLALILADAGIAPTAPSDPRRADVAAEQAKERPVVRGVLDARGTK